MKIIRSKVIRYIFTVLFCCTAVVSFAQPTQFGGPNRNGVYNETGLLDSWPEEGPELVSTISGIGYGYGSPAITKKGIFIAGMIDTIGYVFHFNHEHSLIWKTRIGPEFNYKYTGARGTPTIQENRLYYIASMGDAVCLDTETGEKIWNFNVIEKYNGPKIKWGYTESPLIYEEKIYFTPGGPGKNFVALDKMTGKEIWTVDIDSTMNSYCSPVIINHNGRDLILLNSSHFLLLIDPDDGELVVKHPLSNTRYNHALAPLYSDGKLFYTSGYGEGTTLFEIQDGSLLLDTIYQTSDLDCKLSGLIHYEGAVFGTSDKRRLWVGIDFITGETLFTSRDFKAGSFILAEDKFYMFSDQGEVALGKPSRTGIEIESRFHIPAGIVSYAFAIPVLHEGILYIRFNNDLWLYKVDK